jgi:hypothetical protein
MTETWQFQIRITVAPELASALRAHEQVEGHDLLEAILRDCNASLKDQYPLYEWTKDTISNPDKRAKHLKSFTVYVLGEPVYDRQTADRLHARLSALAGEAGIESVSRFDTNPANNPQPPAPK